MTPAVEAPVSRALAAELKKKVRERGIVVWLDTERQYTPLARRLQSGEHLRPPVPFILSDVRKSVFRFLFPGLQARLADKGRNENREAIVGLASVKDVARFAQRTTR